MSYSLNHIEDTMADDRALLVKLVKQNNTIVRLFKTIRSRYSGRYEDTL